ncbi:MAG: hypothetical protein ACR2PK_13050 [Acidimicrobiales bacterium]
MVWLILLVAVVVLACIPLIRVDRACVPRIIDGYDASAGLTAFDPQRRELLESRSFEDQGAHVISIGDAAAVLHLYQRADGTVVTGLCGANGEHPAHYTTTLLAEGGGWLETRRTDRTPGPRQELVQVVPRASLSDLLDRHDRALDAVRGHGVAPVRSLNGLDIHEYLGRATRRSIRRNPVRWWIALLGKRLRPDQARDVAEMPRLEQRLSRMRLA